MDYLILSRGPAAIRALVLVAGPPTVYCGTAPPLATAVNQPQLHVLVCHVTWCTGGRCREILVMGAVSSGAAPPVAVYMHLDVSGILVNTVPEEVPGPITMILAAATDGRGVRLPAAPGLVNSPPSDVAEASTVCMAPTVIPAPRLAVIISERTPTKTLHLSSGRRASEKGK